ncbi:hypothetical protein H7I00_06700 [Mycobacterium bohemicum]|nr:hypothetical protein [Mycobacterium bohemicum]
MSPDALAHAVNAAERAIALAGDLDALARVKTFALRFRAPDRTLTEDDASTARDAAVRRAAEAVGAELRA